MKQKNALIQHKSRRGITLALAAAGLVVVAAIYWPSRSDRSAPPPQPVAQIEPIPTPPVEPKVPPFYEGVEAAGPLPPTLSPEQFQSRLVARAYRLAGRIPEVLAQQPCYCWCDKFGHGSLLDCFATDHGAS
jgi:multidrug efflux pump subunit AcrA (membrane-fusion protein)